MPPHARRREAQDLPPCGCWAVLGLAAWAVIGAACWALAAAAKAVGW